MKKLLKRFALGLATFALVSSLALTGCKQFNGGDGSGDSNGTGNDFDLPPLELDIDLDKASSVEFARSMLIGWNLGNTFDAPTETAWGMPKTTKDMITAVRKAGFRSVRIPVSWSKHIIGDDYKIDDAWINRVNEVVDYAYDQGMYVIINIHHDNYSEAELATANGFALSDNSEIKKKSKDYIEKIWTKIATKFASYDKRLIFEVLNEPRAVGTDDEWYIKKDDDVEKYCDIITSYEQVAINTIRGIKGNEDRFIMVPGYAASGSDTRQLDAYTMPKDTKEQDKLILSAHAYSPFNFAMANSDKTFGDDDKASLDSIFSYLKTNYTAKGIGVIMGEASASNKGNTAEREKWAKYYFSKAKDVGIPVMLWDNMVADEDGHESVDGGFNGEHHGWLHRKSGKWFFPSIVKAMMDVVGAKDCVIPSYSDPTPESIGWNESAATEIYSGKLETGWTAHTFDESKFSGAKEGSILKISCSSANGGTIGMVNGDWSVKYNKGTALNGTLGGDWFSISAGDVDFYYILTASDASDWASKGLGLVGPDLTIKNIKFLK